MRGIYQRLREYVPEALHTDIASLNRKWKHVSKEEVMCWASMYEKSLGPPAKVVAFEGRFLRVFQFHPDFFSGSIPFSLFCELWLSDVEDLPKLMSCPDLLVQSIITARLRDNL